MSAPPAVWIALVEVRQRPGASLLMDRNQAAVHALALADDELGFREAVTSAFDRLGFDVLDIEHAEPLRDRAERGEVAQDLLQLGDEVQGDGLPRFGTFYTWRSEG